MRKFLFYVCMVLFATQANAQVTTTSGKITDDKGTPIVGASILEKGTKNGTLSNNDGTFTLKTKAKANLVITSLGYKSLQVVAGNGLVVTLQNDVNALSEVVVTALGISREKKAISYSAQSVSAADIASGGKSNLIDDLQGKVSGVEITSTGGQAGGGTTIVIRGYNSLTGNNQPLYVVDGVPIDNTSEGGQTGQYGFPSPNRAIDINPDDVDNVTVLKGGAATALYGIQAANGAIIINTKKGKAGKAKIDFSYSNSAATPNKFPAFQKQWHRGAGGIYTNATSNAWGPSANSNPVFPKGIKMDLVGDGEVKDLAGLPIPFYPDNMENFYNTGSGMTNKLNLSVSGASDKTNYFTSLSRMEQEGLIKNNTYQKTNFMANLSSQVTDRFKIGVKMNYINTGGHRFNQGNFSNNMDYYISTFDIINHHTKNLITGNESYWNPGQSSSMWMIQNNGENYDVNRLIANLDLSYKISRDFRLDYKAGMDQYTETRENHDITGTWGYGSNDYTGSINEGRVGSMQLNSELILHYDHKFGQDFQLRSFVGQNVFYKEYDYLNNYGNSFVLPNLYEITNTQTQTISHYSFTKQTVGAYGDVQLDYKNFLFVEGTLRRDWSSTLPRDNMGFTYPSVSAGYVFTEHLKVPWLSYGKIRASYAGTSNDAPVNSLQTAYNNVSPTVLGNVRFTYPTTVGNPTLKPESTTQQEIGLDLGFFNRKITFEGTYFSKRSFDQIIYAPASSITGVSSTLINLGETTNKGIDATLTFNNIVKVKNFSWTSAFNFSKVNSMVVKVGDDGNDQVTLAYGYEAGSEIKAAKGQPFGAIYGYAWTRYGTLKPTDAGYLNQPLLLSAAGKPSKSEEKALLGNTSPDFILAWNNTMKYKDFNFGFTMEWKKGGYVINDYNGVLTYSGKSLKTDVRYYNPAAAGAPTNVLGTKTFVGVDSKGVPVSKPINLDKTWFTTQVCQVDEEFVEEATWLRLRNIYIGYSIPEKLLKPLHINGIDLTFSGRNIWLKTAYTGVDPEVSSTGSGPNGVKGIDIAGIPQTKSWDFSVKFRF